MATRTSQLIVELLDRVSGPARRVNDALQGIGRSAQAAGGGTFTDRLNGAIARNAEALDNARFALADTAAAYYGLRAAFGAPIQAAADFETQLEDIGQKAGIPVEKLAALGEQIKQVAHDTNTSASEIARAVDALVGRGVDVDTALIAADPIGKAATAYRASTEDLAAAAQAAVDNLKVPAQEITTTLDMMAQAGKEGAFELRDMAQFFPSLGAAYQAFGQTGTGAVADIAAALQIVRKGTGDASSAATNLQNVLQKVYAPATVKKFADKGIDVFAEMEAAAQRGLTPIEAIAEITNEALDGDLSKLGTLFEDAQAQAGVRALIQNLEEFRRIRAEALAAQGVVMEDYERRIKTAAGAQARWAASIEHLNVILGTTLMPLLNDLLDALIPMISAVGELAARYPELTRAIVATVAGLVAFRGALAALRFVGLLGQSGALALLAGGMSTVGAAAIRMGGAARSAVALQTALGAMAGGQALGALSKLGIGLRAAVMAVPGVGLLSSAIAGIGAAVATISAPIWGAFALAAAAIAAVGLTVWKYWGRISAVMSGVGQAIGEILSPALEAIRPVLDWFAPLGDVIAAGWRSAISVIQEVGKWIGSVFEQETLSEDDKAKAKQAGYDFIMSLWNGMKQVMADLLSWVKTKAAELLAPFAGLGETIRSYLPGSTVTAADNPAGEFSGLEARAGGGPIRRGQSYLVGEEGPELITARADGFVHTADETRRMLSGAAGSGRSAGRSGGRFVLNLGGMTINALPGQDAREIAAEAVRQIEEKIGAAIRGVQADTGLEPF